jgi:hypothetical protein
MTGIMAESPVPRKITDWSKFDYSTLLTLISGMLVKAIVGAGRGSYYAAIYGGT